VVHKKAANRHPGRKKKKPGRVDYVIAKTNVGRGKPRYQHEKRKLERKRTAITVITRSVVALYSSGRGKRLKEVEKITRCQMGGERQELPSKYLGDWEKKKSSKERDGLNANGSKHSRETTPRNGHSSR